MSLLPLLLVLSAAPAAADAPLRAPVLMALAPSRAGDVPQSLLDARRLAEQLRYEEAIVEYHRYLGDPNRPVAERALALLDLGFLHLVLGDEVSAQARATQALELDPWLKLSPGAPGKQAALLESMRRRLAVQSKLEVLARVDQDSLLSVRARLSDPQGKAKRVLIRHSLSARGPFYSALMRCEAETCMGDIPPPAHADAFTAFYYLEALGEEGESLAQAAGPLEPLQLSVVGRDPWYQRPWVWGVGGAALIAAGAVVYLLSPPPPR